MSIDVIREALEFYANKEHYEPDVDFYSGQNLKCEAQADEGFKAREALAALDTLGVPQEEPLMGKRFAIEHDGFTGTVIGGYITKEGKHGVVLQQDGTRVVHVYGQKWLKEPL